MIVTHDILMILLGAFISAAAILTGQHLYGKRMSVSKETRVESDTRREYPKGGVPPTDKAQFNTMIERINLADDTETYSSQLKEKMRSGR